MKNFKLSVKLIGGFVATALITLIVGLVGYVQLSSMVGHVDTVGKEDMPKVVSLLQMESNLNGLMIGVRTLMSPVIDKETRMAQYDVLNEKRAMYQKYFKQYSGFNQTSQESKLGKEFIAEVGKWAKSNNQAIETSKELMKLDILEPQAYMKNLWMFTSDHYKLASKVGELLASGKEFDGGTDPTACRFGKWLGSYSTTNSEISKILQNVKTPHNHFHESVGKIKTVASQRQTGIGLKVYKDELMPAAENVFGHFKNLRDAATASVAAFTEMNHILITESVQGQKKTMAVMDQLTNLNLEDSEQAVLKAGGDASSGKILVIIGIIIGVIVALVLGIILTREITGPIFKGVAFAQELAKGNFSEQLDIDQKDEVGDLADAMKNMANELNIAIGDINSVMYSVKDGDLSRTVTADLSGDLNLLKESINESITMLGHTIVQVVTNTDQVNSGSAQISSASQSLASGTSEQAASLEEISSTMLEVGSRAKANNENANQAAQLTTQAMEIANRGNEQMKEMLSAMDKINSSSADISKIIKVIDEIAFQTNLLALNAAVEAARAGKYGKGFAVVAEEVRNLAARSAEAAKNTTELIENSVKEVDSGVINAGKTAEVLKEIDEGITKVNDLVGGIAAASQEQSNNTAEINTSLTQVNNVVQQNSSISEEAASASEELSSQAMELQALMGRFKVTQAITGQKSIQTPISMQQDSPPEKVVGAPKMITLDDDNFGKY